MYNRKGHLTYLEINFKLAILRNFALFIQTSLHKYTIRLSVWTVGRLKHIQKPWCFNMVFFNEPFIAIAPPWVIATWFSGLSDAKSFLRRIFKESGGAFFDTVTRGGVCSSVAIFPISHFSLFFTRYSNSKSCRTRIPCRSTYCTCRSIEFLIWGSGAPCSTAAATTRICF